MVLVIELVITQGSGRNGDLARGPLHATLGRPNCAVARIPAPARGPDQERVVAAELVAEREQPRRTVAEQLQFGTFRREPEADGVDLGHRDPEAHAAAQRVGLVVSKRQLVGIERPAVDVEAPRYAVHRIVRFGERKRQDLADRAAVDLGRKGLAAAEYVRLRDRALQDEAVRVGKAYPDEDVAGGPLLDPHGHIHLICGAGHWRCLDLHFGKVLRLVDALLGQLQLCRVVERTLELAHFPAHDLVAGARVADDIYSPYVHPPSRVDHDGKGDAALIAIDLGHGVRVGERVAFVSEAVDDLLAGLGQLLARERLARLYGHQLAQFLLRYKQLAAEPDVGDGVFLALGYIDGDIDGELVGRDGNLGRIDAEV